MIDTYKNKEIPSEEFFDFLKKRQGILDGVCVTGGEPLNQHGIEDFLRRIKELGYAVKLDTNGSFPDKPCPDRGGGACGLRGDGYQEFPGKLRADHRDRRL